MTAPVVEPTPEPQPEAEEFDWSSIRLEDESDEVVPPKATKSTGKSSDKSSTDSTSGTRSKASKSPLPRYTEGKYVKPVMTFYGFIATGIGMTGDQVCATAVMENGEAIAIQWDRLAKENHAVRRMLEALTQGGAWAGLAIAHLPLLAAMAEHHNRLPTGVAPILQMAVNPPEETADAD